MSAPTRAGADVHAHPETCGPADAAVTLARFVTRSFAAPRTRRVATARLLDTVGAIAAGASVAESRLLVDLCDGHAGREDLLWRARLCCALARCSEVDDIDLRTCVTPGSVAVGVALALAERRECTGAQLLDAICAGYEAMVAVGAAVGGAWSLYAGSWPSYLAAPVAGAATAARMLGLGPATVAEALSIAAARATGHGAGAAVAPTARWMLYGSAAADGLLASLAARAGLRGDPSALGALCHQRAGRRAPPVAGRRAPAGAASPSTGSEPAQEDEPAVTRAQLKPFCTARQTQAAVQAAIAAAAELGSPDAESIAAVEVAVPHAYRSMIDRPEPRGRVDSIVSAQFQVAAALSDERILLDVAREAPKLPAAGAALMARIRVLADELLDQLYPALWPARVRIVARDGRQAVRVAGDGRGAEGSTGGIQADLDATDLDAVEVKHRRLGALGAGLGRATVLCREVAGARAAPAAELLELALKPL
ncbi:MAG TPA: MmgE/PrpD family protein [Solirubrobacteraceae bacterium]|nr:MmgE/PrpD family protein [Solirubrobacteraceae bacterium]